MSQTRARKLYRRWSLYAHRCYGIGGSPGNRVPVSVARAGVTLFRKQVRRPMPHDWPTITLHGWPG